MILLAGWLAPASAAVRSQSLAVTATVTQACTVAIPIVPNRIAAACQTSAGAALAPNPTVIFTPDSGGGAGLLTISF